MCYRKLLGITAFALLATSASAQTYPDREISGVIQWGAGGATDVAMRSLTPYAEEALGKKIVLQNKAGGVGVIANNFVTQQAADGYTLLMGAEAPLTYGVMALSDIDYSKFYPVNIVARGTILVVANKDKPWKNFKDLLADVQANPGKIKQYSAGPGTTPFTVNAMISNLTSFKTMTVPFDGDGPGMTAMQGGHIDFGFISVGAAAEHIKAGRVKALAVIDADDYENIPSITKDLPGIGKYLPWGPFYGVFVKQETPEPVKTKLVAAFKKAADHPKYKEMMVARGTVMMNIGGEEASKFLKKWQSVTAWTYDAAGIAKKSPAALGIPKP